jgi:protein SCO1/2
MKLIALALLYSCAALSESKLPGPLGEIGIDQKLNAQVPLDLRFVDESGKQVLLRELISKRPVVLAPVYFNCPMLCTLVLNGLSRTLKSVSLNPGEDFDIVAVSFDPREHAELAAAKKRGFVETYARTGAITGTHFLTGDQAQIAQLMSAIGFRYKYDSATAQYAHSSGFMVLTPEGKLARYFYGIDYKPRDLRLALVEASHNRIGSPTDQLLLFCFHYDPVTGKYGPAIQNAIRIAGIGTVLAIGVLFVSLRRRERKEMR